MMTKKTIKRMAAGGLLTLAMLTAGHYGLAATGWTFWGGVPESEWVSAAGTAQTIDLIGPDPQDWYACRVVTLQGNPLNDWTPVPGRHVGDRGLAIWTPPQLYEREGECAYLGVE